MLPDDLLEGKRVENMTTANLVNRAPNSDIQERSIPWLHLNRAFWHSQ